MGRFVSAYLVDLEKIEASIGSGNAALLEEVSEYFQLEDTASTGSEWDVITEYQALEAVINGGPFLGQCADRYVDAIEGLSLYFGVEQLGSFGPYHGDSLGDLDEALGVLGVDAIWLGVFEGGGHMGEISLWVEGAGGGTWTHEECKQAVAQWDATTSEQRARLGGDAEEELSVRWMTWARRAAESEGLGIIGWHTS